MLLLLRLRKSTRPRICDPPRRIPGGSRQGEEEDSDSRVQDDSAGSRSRPDRLETTGSRRAGGRRTDATRRDATSATAVSTAQLEDKAGDATTDWCSCRRTKIHLERGELWFASSGGSCGRTMARRRWDAGSSQIAIAMERGGSVLDGW